MGKDESWQVSLMSYVDIVYHIEGSLSRHWIDELVQTWSDNIVRYQNSYTRTQSIYIYNNRILHLCFQ